MQIKLFLSKIKLEKKLYFITRRALEKDNHVN